MVKLSPKIKEYMENMIKRFQEVEDPVALERWMEVETELEEDIRSRARAGDFNWTSDFVPWNPKAAKGPSPLSYFISSMGLCQQSHYAEEAALSGLTLDLVRIKTRARLDVGSGEGFKEVIYETRIESPEKNEAIMNLVERAENGCYVTSTLKRSLRITGRIYLNGEELVERTHGG